MVSGVPDGVQPDDFGAEKTTLGEALGQCGISFEAYDYTTQNGEFWHRNYAAAKDLKEEFEDEGNGFIPASLIREAENDFLPPIEAGTMVRYLYHVRR